MDIAFDNTQTYKRSSQSATITPKDHSVLSKRAVLHNRLAMAKRQAICLSRSIRIFFVDVSVIVGKEKVSGETIRTLYIGEPEKPRRSFGKFYSDSEAVEKHDNYLSLMESIYSNYQVVIQKKNVGSFQVNRWIRKFENQVDLIFIDVELLFSHLIDKSKYISLPQWVPQKLSIPDTWDAVLLKFRKSLRKKLRRVLRKEFRYIISNSEQHFHQFYSQMYVPYTNRRFGNLSVVYSHKTLMKQFYSGGHILFLLMEDKVILGQLLRQIRDRMAAIAWGASSNMNPSEMSGAFDVLTYYCILDAFERGCKQFDLLGSRPFLEDGIFQFKRKWGTFIDTFYEPLSNIYLKICNFGAGTTSYILNNPLITKRGDKFIGRILLTEKASSENVDRLIREYSTEGLHRIDVYCLKGIHKEINEYIIENGLHIKMYDLSNSKSPEQDFSMSDPSGK